MSSAWLLVCLGACAVVSVAASGVRPSVGPLTAVAVADQLPPSAPPPEEDEETPAPPPWNPEDEAGQDEPSVTELESKDGDLESKDGDYDDMDRRETASQRVHNKAARGATLPAPVRGTDVRTPSKSTCRVSALPARASLCLLSMFVLLCLFGCG